MIASLQFLNVFQIKIDSLLSSLRIDKCKPFKKGENLTIGNHFTYLKSSFTESTLNSNKDKYNYFYVKWPAQH